MNFSILYYCLAPIGMVLDESDFFRPEFLSDMLFFGQNLVLRPLPTTGKLWSLMEVLGKLWKVQSIVSEFLQDPESLRMALEQFRYDPIKEKPPLVFIRGITPQILAVLGEYPHLRFFATDPDPGRTYLDSGTLRVYNMKRAAFETPALELAGGAEVFRRWAEEIVVKVRAGLDGTLSYLDGIMAAVDELADIAVDYSRSRFYFLMEPFSEDERLVIMEMCREGRGINLDELMPEGEMENYGEHKFSVGRATDLDEDIAAVEALEQPAPIPLPKKVSPAVANEGSAGDIMQEFYRIAEGGAGYEASLAKAIFDVETKKEIPSPEEKYLHLRQTQWKRNLPESFLTRVLTEYINQQLITHPVSPKGLATFITLEHRKLCALFGPIVPKTYLKKPPLDAISHDRGIQHRLAAFEAQPKTLPLIPNPPTEVGRDMLTFEQYLEKHRAAIRAKIFTPEGRVLDMQTTLHLLSDEVNRLTSEVEKFF